MKQHEVQVVSLDHLKEKELQDQERESLQSDEFLVDDWDLWEWPAEAELDFNLDIVPGAPESHTSDDPEISEEAYGDDSENGT